LKLAAVPVAGGGVSLVVIIVGSQLNKGSLGGKRTSYWIELAFPALPS
jgi:hypothetical protein